VQTRGKPAIKQPLETGLYRDNSRGWIYLELVRKEGNSTAGIERTVSHVTYTYHGYVDVEPSVRVLVRIVRLEYETVVVHKVKVIVVVLAGARAL